MKRQDYLKPAMLVVKMGGVETLLTGSEESGGSAPPIKGETEGGGGLEYGGDTKPDQKYEPW